MLDDGNIVLSASARQDLSCDGVAFTLGSVDRAWERVDVVGAGKRIFLVEHVTAICAMLGVHGAEVSGTTTTWDEGRPSHVAAKAAGAFPAHVLGRVDVRIWGGATSGIMRAALPSLQVSFSRLIRPVVFSDPRNGTRIRLSPPKDPDLLRITCVKDAITASTVLSPMEGLPDAEERERVAQA